MSFYHKNVQSDVGASLHLLILAQKNTNVGLEKSHTALKNKTSLFPNLKKFHGNFLWNKNSPWKLHDTKIHGDFKACTEFHRVYSAFSRCPIFLVVYVYHHFYPSLFVYFLAHHSYISFVVLRISLTIHIHIHRCWAELLSSCDLPAKAPVSNMKAYNGKYGCATWKDIGVGSLNPLHHIWSFHEDIASRNVTNPLWSCGEKKEAVSFNCSYNIVGWHDCIDDW